MIDAANYSATETLRDGGMITIRAQRPGDLDGWRAALGRTSAETRYFRFFAAKAEVSEKEAQYFLDIDFVEHVALVAVADENGSPTLIGGARYYVVEPGKAEIAFGLIDEYQAKGIGTALNGICRRSSARRLARTGGGDPLGQPSDAKGS
jgi:hypothetical protein